MATFTFTEVVQTPDGQLSQPVEVTGSRFQSVDDTVATAVTDQLVAVDFTLAAVKGIYIVSDAAITLETNATDHTGGDQISLQANVPLVWWYGGYYTNLFTANVTKFYLTNASGSTATYSIRVLSDGTP